MRKLVHMRALVHNPDMEQFAFAEVCRMLGKDAVQIRTIQRALGLHMPSGAAGYSRPYVTFLEGVVALWSFHVPMEDIKEIFETEKKILSLLHVDTLTESPTWYLDGCGVGEGEASDPDRLLLTRHKVEAMSNGHVQHTFDFGKRDPELFRGVEMGEDLRRVIAKYLKLESALRRRIARERPVLRNALQWSKAFLDKSGR